MRRARAGKLMCLRFTFIVGLVGSTALICTRLIPSGIRAIKLYAWEEPFKRRIEALRAAELHEIRCMAVVASSPSPRTQLLWTQQC